MNVTVTGRHFDVTEGIKAHIGAKIAKLEKFYSKIIEVHVILAVEKFRHIVEITLVGKHIKLTATETTSDMYASIDKAIESLEKQLRKVHDKVKEHHRVPGLAARSISAIRGYFKSEKKVAEPSIVETRRVAEKPMSIGEAADELKLSNDEFLVFRNSDDDKINIIYKRKDGNLGLINT